MRIIAKIKRVWIQFRLFTIRDGWKKALYLKKHHIFRHIGDGCYYASILLPAEPELVYLHDNVIISAGVRLVTHSVSHIVFNKEENTNKFVCRFGKIEIMDNVYIGADSIIQYGVTIGSNSIIAAGCVVTKDLECGSVWGGVPAKRRSSYAETKEKFREYSKQFGEEFTGDTWVSDLIKAKPIEFYGDMKYK